MAKRVYWWKESRETLWMARELSTMPWSISWRGKGEGGVGRMMMKMRRGGWKREDDGEDEKKRVGWEDGGRGRMMVKMQR